MTMSMPIRRTALWWVAIAIVLLLPGCAKQDTRALIIVKGATNVHYATVGGGRQVRYEVKQHYPAAFALKEISDRLGALGYKPLQHDYLNPGQPSSHVRGWTFFLDGTKTPEEGVDQWLAQWKNGRGNVVQYALQYRSPEKIIGADGKDQLIVYGILIR